MSQLKLISQEEIASYLGEGQLFVLFRCSVERMKPTPVLERAVGFVYGQMFVLQKCPRMNPQNNVRPSTWVLHGSVKWAHNINLPTGIA